MLKHLSTLFIICFASFSALAQTEKYTAPVKWERYKVGDKDVSILFPKLPILIKNTDSCGEMEKREYAAYAEGVVYGLNLTFQLDRKAPDFCKDSGESRKFDEKRFEDRLKELTTWLKTEKAEKTIRKNLQIIKISNEFFAHWLINDFKNKRWFEVWTTDPDEKKLLIKEFVDSIRIEKNASGVEIKQGASRTLGDESANISKEKNADSSEEGELQQMRIILKPRAAYTEEARQAQFQGTVRLRVIFTASGGIGSIEPVSKLPFGMTEQAVAVAAKIVFIPAKRNNKPISMARIVEYHFNIY